MMESAAGSGQRSSSALLYDHSLDRSSSSTIDCLADELIVNILSFLSTTKDAATTSILSKRWRHLWKLTGRVHLSIQRLNSVDLALSSFGNDPDSFPLRELSIEDPLLSFDRTIGDCAMRWISFAIDDLNVQVLSILLGANYLFPPRSSWKRNYNLMHLKLSCCELRPNFEEFRNLRSISLLNRSRVPDAALENINLNCTLLESLELDVCGLTHLRVSSSLCRLKYLKLDCSSVETMFIESPNLEHLEYHGKFPKQGYQLLAPRLKVLTLPGEGRTFSSTVTLLQSLIIGRLNKLDLHLHPREPGQDFDYSRPTPLNHVKELSLTIVPMNDNLGGLVAFLRASSSLQLLKLFLFQWWSDGLPDLDSGDSGSDCSWRHLNLRKISIHWFNSSSHGHLSLLKYLVEVAIGLEEIEIVLEVGSSSSEDLSKPRKCIEDYIGGNKLLHVSIPGFHRAS